MSRLDLGLFTASDSLTAMSLRAMLRRRVEYYMRERGLDQSGLAALMKRQPSWANMYLKGSRDLPLVTIEQLAKALRIDPLDLFRDPGEAVPATGLESFGLVPLLKARIAAGSPLAVEPDADLDSHLSFSQGLLRNYPGAVCVHVGAREESMYPTIMPGDTLLLDRRHETRTTPRTGGVFAVNYSLLTGDRGAAVKRIEVSGKSLIVSSDNPRG